MATLKNTTVSDTNGVAIPSGNTAARPSPAAGMVRLNTSIQQLESYVTGTTPAWDGVTGIVSSNLAFNMDANNYPGSGSTWTDSTSNAIVMNAQGTQTPFVTLNGAKCFQFNSSGWWASSTADGQKFYMGNGSTLEIWMYYQGIQSRHNIFEKNGNSYASYQQELACTLEYGYPGNMSFYRKGGQSGTYDYAGCDMLIMNQWNHLCVMLEPGAAGAGYSIFNLGPRNYGYGLRDANNLPLASNEIRIGNGYTGIMDRGYVAIVRVYTKILSDAEVFQNYQALRGRFGV